MNEKIKKMWDALDPKVQAKIEAGIIFASLLGGFAFLGVVRDRRLDDLCGDGRSRCITVEDEFPTCGSGGVCGWGSHWELKPAERK